MRRALRATVRTAKYAVVTYGTLLGIVVGYTAADIFVQELRLARNSRRADREARDG